MLGKQIVLMTLQSLPETGVNVQAQVEAAVNEVVSEPRKGEPENTQRRVEQLVIPWPTTDMTPASEFTTPELFYNGISLFVSLWKG